MTPKAYKQAFLSNQYNPAVEVKGLVGRILRGRKPEDFETLTDAPNERKIIQLTDSTGLQSLLGLSTMRDRLNSIGWDNKFIDDKLQNGYQFKLVVFPADNSPARRAWWFDQLDVCGQAWPQLNQLFQQQPLLNLLRLQSWQSWDAYCKMSYNLGIAELPGNHPLRLTPDDLAKNFSPLAVRVFLYYYAQLKELYSGDGWTYDNMGRRCLPEYTMANMSINKILGAETFDITV